MSTHNLKPLSEVIKELKERSFDTDFIFKNNKLYAVDKNQYFESYEVTVKDNYRFEGDSDPADMCILYAIETSNGHKGLLVDTYGAQANTELEEFLEHAHYEARR